MTRIIVLSVLCIISSKAFAQYPVEFAMEVASVGVGNDGNAGNNLTHIVPDRKNGSVACGFFYGKIEIGATTYTANGPTDILIFRLDAGGKIMWSRVIGFADPEIIFGSGVDADNHYYFLVGFSSSEVIDGIPISPGSNLLKFSDEGTLLGTKRVSGIFNAAKFAVRANGDFLIFGMYGDGFEVGGTQLHTVDGGLVGAYFNADGTVRWLHAFEAEHDLVAADIPDEIVLRDDGSCFLTGTFAGKITIGSSVITTRPRTFHELLVRVDLDGTIKDMHNFRVGSITSGGNIVETTGSGVFDHDGNFYFAKSFLDTLEVGGKVTPALKQDPAHNAYISDLVVMKYTPAGNLEWTKLLASNGDDRGIVRRGPDQKIYLLGYVYEAEPKVQLGSETIPTGGYFLTELQSAGSAFRSTQINIDITYSGILDFNIDSQGNFLFTGIVDRFTDFNPMNNLPPSYNFQSGYVGKYHYCNEPLPLSAVTGRAEVCRTSDNIITVHANPLAPSAEYNWEIITVTKIQKAKSYVDSLVVNLDSSTQSPVTIRVSSANRCGTLGPGKPLVIKIVDAPAEPIVTRKCNRFVSAVKDSATWYTELNTLIKSDPGQQLIEFTPVDSGYYYLKTLNTCGSATSLPFWFSPYEEKNDQIPNVITPDDADHLNEFFILTPRYPPSSLSVFNRWGEVVYRSSAYDNKWDANGLKEGVYYFSLRNDCHEGAVKGWVEVIR